MCCNRFNLHNDVDLEEIARACPTNLTGADLYSLCTDAMLATLRKHINELEMQGNIPIHVYTTWVSKYFIID